MFTFKFAEKPFLSSYIFLTWLDFDFFPPSGAGLQLPPWNYQRKLGQNPKRNARLGTPTFLGAFWLVLLGISLGTPNSGTYIPILLPYHSRTSMKFLWEWYGSRVRGWGKSQEFPKNETTNPQNWVQTQFPPKKFADFHSVCDLPKGRCCLIWRIFGNALDLLMGSWDIAKELL